MTAVIAEAAIAAPVKAQGLGRNRPGGVWINAGPGGYALNRRLLRVRWSVNLAARCAAWLERGSTGKNRSIVDKVMPGPGRGFLARNRHIFDRIKALSFKRRPSAGWPRAQARRSVLCAARPERLLRKQGCALSLTASPAFKYAHDLGPGQRVPERSLKYLAVLFGKFL